MSQPKPNSPAKSAILVAFKNLVLDRPYHEISVGNVIATADVSRSTFYEHFRNIDDLLRQSISPIMGILATAGFPDADTGKIQFVLNHFQETGDLARTFLNGSASSRVVKILAESITKQIHQFPIDSDLRLDSAQHRSLQTAESTMGIIRAWLNQPGTPIDEITNSIQSVARILLQIPI